ncbi:MAG: outer membrane protein assembly factor BamE [Desulfovibrionaceae bacterium]|jgi:outer membrane protein assembly factor BamE (lipoprotein component of BamABCDE complex)|nr:outer membrane protein assembly factor BamE [Desulfovibrionaceae bacterium]
MNYSPIIPAIVAAAVTVAGCASSGRQIEQANIQKIVPGATTKDQMLAMFGPPLSQSYGTEGKLVMNWHYAYVGPFGSGMKQQILTVLFDQQEKVERFNMTDNDNAGPRLGR